MCECKDCQCYTCAEKSECDTCRSCRRNYKDFYSKDNWCNIKREEDEE